MTGLGAPPMRTCASFAVTTEITAGCRYPVAGGRSSHRLSSDELPPTAMAPPRASPRDSSPSARRPDAPPLAAPGGAVKPRTRSTMTSDATRSGRPSVPRSLRW